MRDTGVWDAISRYGNAVTRKRAYAKDPAYAERDRIRHNTRPGVVLGTEGPGGLDGFFDDIAVRNAYRPLWFKTLQRFHWWMEKNGPSATYRNAKYFWQRGKRGYSDRDLWSFDTYLSNVIRDGVRSLNEIKHGWPGEPLTFEDWGAILEEISDGMQAHLDIMNLNYDWKNDRDNAEAALRARRDLSLDHLKTWWGNLWD